MQQVVMVNGIHLFHECTGTGEPLLLIPGLGAGLWLWRHNSRALAEHFTLIMPELRGSGRSDKPDRRYSIPMFAEDMQALLDALEFDTVHLLGASLGGFVAQYFAASWPQRVQSLVLVSSSLGGDRQIGPSGEVLSRTIRPRGKTRRERLEQGYAFNFSDDFIRDRHPELDHITDWRLQHPQPEFAYYRQLLAGNAYDGAPHADKIAAPTLICAGKDDPLVPLADARLLAEAIPSARLQVFEGRHLFFYEHARQFNHALLQFLKEGV